MPILFLKKAELVIFPPSMKWCLFPRFLSILVPFVLYVTCLSIGVKWYFAIILILFSLIGSEEHFHLLKNLYNLLEKFHFIFPCTMFLMRLDVLNNYTSILNQYKNTLSYMCWVKVLFQHRISISFFFLLQWSSLLLWRRIFLIWCRTFLNFFLQSAFQMTLTYWR